VVEFAMMVMLAGVLLVAVMVAFDAHGGIVGRSITDKIAALIGNGAKAEQPHAGMLDVEQFDPDQSDAVPIEVDQRSVTNIDLTSLDVSSLNSPWIARMVNSPLQPIVGAPAVVAPTLGVARALPGQAKRHRGLLDVLWDGLPQSIKELLARLSQLPPVAQSALAGAVGAAAATSVFLWMLALRLIGEMRRMIAGAIAALAFAAGALAGVLAPFFATITNPVVLLPLGLVAAGMAITVSVAVIKGAFTASITLKGSGSG
jgi:hypothetical protein